MRSIVVLLGAAVVTACGGGSPTENGGGGGGGGGGGSPVVTTSVAVSNSSFAPPAIRVSPSATVTWTNSDGIAHNVTFSATTIADIAAWTSGPRTSTMPAAAGTYPYTCALHSGMSGSVQVQ